MLVRVGRSLSRLPTGAFSFGTSILLLLSFPLDDGYGFEP
jgi:hypothetical protein